MHISEALKNAFVHTFFACGRERRLEGRRKEAFL